MSVELSKSLEVLNLPADPVFTNLEQVCDAHMTSRIRFLLRQVNSSVARKNLSWKEGLRSMISIAEFYAPNSAGDYYYLTNITGTDSEDLYRNVSSILLYDKTLSELTILCRIVKQNMWADIYTTYYVQTAIKQDNYKIKATRTKIAPPIT